MTRYAKALTDTPQTEQAGPAQVPNSAGGFTFELDIWGQLDRWLILGSEGGTYYAKEAKLTLGNARTIQACLAADGLRTVARIVEISKAGRAPKNDPAIFALAIAFTSKERVVLEAASLALPLVCRTGTHLFQFCESVNSLRGWGRALRRAVARWYTLKTPEALAYQVAKYRQRGGWSHRDVLRLAHPPQIDDRAAIFRWIATGSSELGPRTLHRRCGPNSTLYSTQKTYDAVGSLPPLLEAFEELQHFCTQKRACELIAAHRITHEMLPSHLKEEDAVWRTLLEHMPMTALIRHLGALTARGLLAPLSNDLKLVLDKLGDTEALTKSRVHPISVLAALCTYQQGHGVRGKLTWTPVPQVVDALNAAFYAAFGNVEKSGKKTLMAIDVSGSMGWGDIAGVPGLTPAMAAAAMAMVRARVEDQWHVFGFSNTFRELPISPSMGLQDILRITNHTTFGSTDCSLPIQYAAKNKLQVDAFEVYTDNETYAGRIHPHQALKKYRKKFTPNATLAVVGCTATKFTIADPSDPGMLDVVGFDTATPNLLASFSKGWQ